MLSLENVLIQEGCHPDPFPCWCLEFMVFFAVRFYVYCIWLLCIWHYIWFSYFELMIWKLLDDELHYPGLHKPYKQWDRVPLNLLSCMSAVHFLLSSLLDILFSILVKYIHCVGEFSWYSPQIIQFICIYSSSYCR